MPSDAALPAPSASPVPPGPIRAFWRAFRENRGAVIGLAVVSLIFLIAIFANVLAPHDPMEQYRGFSKLPPFWMEGSDPRFLLGTDAVGRDMSAYWCTGVSSRSLSTSRPSGSITSTSSACMNAKKLTIPTASAWPPSSATSRV